MNHFHELTDQHEIVKLAGEEFVANKQAIDLLVALNKVGLITRTHHIDHRQSAFVSILLTEGVTFEIRKVNEGAATRTKYNGMTELLISWNKPL